MQKFSLSITYNQLDSQKLQLQVSYPDNCTPIKNIFLLTISPETKQKVSHITEFDCQTSNFEQAKTHNIKVKQEPIVFSHTPSCSPKDDSFDACGSLTCSTMTSPSKETVNAPNPDDIFEISTNLDSDFGLETFSIDQDSRNESSIKPTSKMMNQSRKIKKESDLKGHEGKKKSTSTRKCQWSAEEDARIIELLSFRGPKWADIAEIIGGRTGKQVRDRYMNILRPGINHNEWTEDEDKLFISLYQQLGKKWCQIAAHLPGRTESQVKNRFYSQSKKQPSERFAITTPNDLYNNNVEINMQLPGEEIIRQENAALKGLEAPELPNINNENPYNNLNELSTVKSTAFCKPTESEEIGAEFFNMFNSNEDDDFSKVCMSPLYNELRWN